jgi:class 3 adenylate cyclase
MPTYLDVHNVPAGTTAEDMARAHTADVQVQGRYGVNYIKYYFNEAARKVFCLCDAPNAEAAEQVHREAHGLVADQIIPVDPHMAELFLGGSEISSTDAAAFGAGGGAPLDPAIRTVIFTDIVGSTSLTQLLGDEAAMEFLRVHDEVVRDALKACQGREVKHTGDGIMASFVSAAGAVRCAARIQNAIAKATAPQRLQLRIGAAAGEPVERNQDIFGSTVQLAARLCAHAEPEQILVSNVVAELCIGKSLAFRSLGEVSLKGFDRSIHVHAVEWSDGAGAIGPCPQ